MIELKNFALSREFKDDAEEIRFFKYQKPLILGRLLYFYKLYQIESNRPPNYELAAGYYQCEIEKLKTVFERSLSFFQYYRSGATYRDSFFPDNGSPSAGSRIRLVRKANSSSTAISRATSRSYPVDSSASGSKLYWTDKKAAAVELIYGIHAVGSVDNGKVDIIDIVTAFERTFHIDLGDVYHTFIAMRNRKNSRTVYLDQMIEKLLKRMDESDS